jgi:hypothetical protein
VFPVTYEPGFYIPEDDILPSFLVKPQILHRINCLDFVAETYVSHVGYELGFYVPEDGILHSHCRENLKSYLVNAASLE